MTPAECMDAILKMRTTNPHVHQATTLQEVHGLSTEDMLSVLAYHLLEVNSTVTRDYLELLQRTPSRR